MWYTISVFSWENVVMMMCAGKIFRKTKSDGNVGILHTHTLINPAEKIFNSQYKEATNEDSWSNFLCRKGEKI